MAHSSLRIAFSTIIFISLCYASSCTSEKKVTTKPNIIYILAYDLWAYGQTKIETPNIDALSKDGMLFTQHYSVHLSVLHHVQFYSQGNT